MRVLILVSFFTFCSLGSWSQDTTYVYFDGDWKKTKKKENASYLRKFYRLSSNEWRVEDYFINGGLQMEGSYAKKNLKTEVGKFVYYYEDGGLDYYGVYESGLEQGEWTYYFQSGAVAAKEVYNNGEARTFQFYDTEGNLIKGASYRSEPSFPGGQKAMSEFIQKNIVYPAEATEMGFKGTVYLEFVVAEDGSIDLLKVSKSVHPLLDNEAMRVVKLMPTWVPGKLHNRPIRFRFTLPIKFSLS